jgi:hypothetical protein
MATYDMHTHREREKRERIVKEGLTNSRGFSFGVK